MNTVKLKSVSEILVRLQNLVRRYRRRFILRNLKPCPYNCKNAKIVGRKVVGCVVCGSTNPEFCKNPKGFTPVYTKQELVEPFNRGLRDPEVLLQDYRDIVAFMWVLGQFDIPAAVPEAIIQSKAENGSPAV